MELSDAQIADLSKKIADLFLQAERQSTQIQAASEQSVGDDANTIKLKLKGYRTALGVCRRPQAVREKMRELEAQINSPHGRCEPIAASKRFGKDVYSPEQELVMALAESEALSIGDGQMVRQLNAKDRVYRLRRELGLI